ncbi:MAG: class I SAM-dependent rRNA methyltransferase, partial [Chloroflexota bacterium]|nr:class I SAM-dependent rRNA methyltransferase [Chloroflexota bacterium]
PSGTWVRVKAGGWSGYALWDATSPIALRVFSQRVVPDERWVAARVRAAWALRAPIREQQETTAYRWLFGEGDYLPGVTADLYGPYAVLVTYAESLETILPWIVEAMHETVPLQGIVRRIRGQQDEETGKIELLWGRLPPRDLVIVEHGLRFRADLYEGQKTALFLDQRENRRYLENFAAGKRVLNLFSYSGAFSLYAARGGATHITSVDIAPGAAIDARENFVLNGFEPELHEFVVADVFDYLEQQRVKKQRFDLVICDPPSFARSKDQLPQAIKAYTRVNAMGLRVTETDGLYAASSCTTYVSPDTFRDILADAARQAGRRFQIIHDAGHPLDHPIMAQHMEGRYLKFVVGRVESIW